MRHLEINTLKKYVKIYLILSRFAMIRSTTYRLGFLFEIVVESGYALMVVIFFQVIYSNVTEIAGWTYNEILFLVGLTIVVDELLVGSTYVNGLKYLPSKIKDGDVDFALLKPFNALFNLSLGNPYFTGIIATVPGFFLMAYSYTKLEIQLSAINIISAIFIALCGLIIAYSIYVVFASTTFIFINAKRITGVGNRIVFDYGSNPHTIYRGFVKTIFFYILPIVFITSIPARTFLSGVDTYHLILAPTMAFISLFVAVKIWNEMIKHYSSASS